MKIATLASPEAFMSQPVYIVYLDEKNNKRMACEPLLHVSAYKWETFRDVREHLADAYITYFCANNIVQARTKFQEIADFYKITNLYFDDGSSCLEST